MQRESNVILDIFRTGKKLVEIAIKKECIPK